MIKEGYKITELGEIPQEWDIYKLIDIYDIKTGTTPSTKIKDYWNSGNINWITPLDLSKMKNGLKIFSSERKITEKALKESSLKVLPPNSIIISTRAPVGYIAINENKTTFNQGCKGLVPKPTISSITNFYAYYLLSKIDSLKSLSGGSTFKELSKNSLETFKIPMLPIEEQQKIADILTTVDDKIELINKEIELTEKLKIGLMQRLLTKGIGHNKFKLTELGEIPEEWEYLELGDHKVVEKAKAGGTPLRSAKKYYENGTIPFVKIEDMTNYPKFIVKTSTYITEEGLNNSSSWLTPANSILFSMYASYGEVSINKIAVATNQAIISIIPNKNNVDINFLYYELKNLKKSLKRFLRSTTQNNLNAEIVKGLKIVLPPLPEQQKIAEILTTVDDKINLLKNKKDKLEMLKKGLMNDLLTGKVRVKIDDK